MFLVRAIARILRAFSGGNNQTPRYDNPMAYALEQLRVKLRNHGANPVLVDGTTPLRRLKSNSMGWTALPGTVTEGVTLMALPTDATELRPSWSEGTPMLVYYTGSKHYALVFRGPRFVRPRATQDSNTGVTTLGTFLGEVEAGPLAAS